MLMPDAPFGLAPTGQPAPMQEGEFTPAARNQEVHFATCEIDPPSQNYIDVDDTFFCGFLPQNTVTNGPIINLRILRPKGQIELVQFAMVGTSGGTYFTQSFKTREGYLLSAEILPGAGVAANTFQFATLSIRRGGSGITNEQRLLISDYLTTNIGASWPERPTQRPSSGPGIVFSVAVGNPAAGSDWLFTSPVAQRFSVTYITATLATSATVATRTASLVISDAVAALATIDSLSTQAAGLTNTYSGLNGAFQGGTGLTHFYWPIPQPTLLGSGWRIASLTNNIQAGDQWSLIRLGGILWADYI